ncbi:MAG: transglycosylase SLT domain-containing protein [Proteobacteria bacterium]|nr:transglycosylase SLT domain-containing protein [Pseudomonadota bacterium]
MSSRGHRPGAGRARRRRPAGAKPRPAARAGSRAHGARQWWRRLPRTPATLRWIAASLALLALAAAVNIGYQVIRKPTELFYPVSSALGKSPQQTWAEYGALFRRYATPAISAELLAALAQVEASGNPLVRTYWRWSWVARPFEIYRPASSAVGMYQITDGTFAEARHYCIREHHAMPCGFTRPYLRVLPADAVEMTAALLDVQVRQILSRTRLRRVSAAQRARLAAAVHLCGAGAGALYAQRGFRFAPGARCGDHDPTLYIARVQQMRELFAHLAARDPPRDPPRDIPPDAPQ